MTVNITPHDYQKYCVNKIILTKKLALFLDMGAGKSLITLLAINHLKPNYHILIVAPKVVAQNTWASEIDKWGFDLKYKSLIVNEKGNQLSKKKREDLLKTIPDNKTPTIYFVNVELFSKLVDFYGDKWPFAMVVIDESQRFKSHKSSRFKAMEKVIDRTYRTILLSGTPTPKGLHDLWSQIYILDKGKRLGKNITTFRNRWFRSISNNAGIPISYIEMPNANKEIHDLIKDIVVSVEVKVELPELYIKDHILKMSEKEEKLYKTFMKDYVLELDGNVVEAKNAAVLAGKLSQLASGAIYINDNKDYKVVHTLKCEMTEYLIENTNGPVLIAYYFKSDLDMLESYFKKKKMKYEVFDKSLEMEKRWNKREIPIMLLHPASGGVGTNLQQGSSTLIWYTVPWSLELYQQTNKRLYRQGQKETTYIHRLITKKTIDEKIIKAQETKRMTQDDLLDAVTVTCYNILDKKD